MLGKAEGCVAPGDAFARCRQQDGQDAQVEKQEKQGFLSFTILENVPAFW